MEHNSDTAKNMAAVLHCGLRSYVERYGMPAWHTQHALADIINCRTEPMGTHAYRCDACGHDVRLHNSCRNRHCPQCQRIRQAQWVEARMNDVLPVQYFHIVFTIPDLLTRMVMKQPADIYKILFAAASQTMLQLAADKRWLGAKIGFIAVLHTWGQKLVLHPHLHLIVPGGGIRTDKELWKNTPQDFFIPFRVLAAVFKGKFMDILRKKCASELNPALITALYKKNWVVYAKKPFANADAVMKYLGQYTHRIAISNKRILSVSPQNVSFAYKDYADGNTRKTMSLPTVEFIRRFLLHILPKGFMRIRSFGILANRNKKDCLKLCRRLLNVRCNKTDKSKTPWYELFKKLSGFDPRICPACHKGMLKLWDIIRPEVKPPGIERLCLL